MSLPATHDDKIIQLSINKGFSVEFLKRMLSSICREVKSSVPIISGAGWPITQRSMQKHRQFTSFVIHKTINFGLSVSFYPTSLGPSNACIQKKLALPVIWNEELRKCRKRLVYWTNFHHEQTYMLCRNPVIISRIMGWFDIIV